MKIDDLLMYYTLNNMTILCLILLGLLVIVFFIYKLKQNRLKALTRELSINNDILESNKHDLEINLTSLKEEVIITSTKLEERIQDIKQLETRELETKNSLEKLDEEYHKIKESNSELFARGLFLQQTVQELKSTLKQLESASNILNEKYFDVSNKYTALQAEYTEKQNSFTHQIKVFEENKQELLKEFNNLSNKIFEEKGSIFLQNSQHSLTNLLEPFKQQLTNFQQRINDIHTVSVKSSSVLESELKRLSDASIRISDEANNLTTALKGDKKLIGNWGELQLERTLQAVGLIKDQHYKTQQRFTHSGDNTTYIPDVVIYLPDGKHLIIDSKVSLIAYEKACSSDNVEQEKEYLAEHIKAIRNHIDDLSKKDYSNLKDINSPNFVLMFIPIEPAYIMALRQDIELFNYGYRKNIILVSHTTLLPILSTISNLWRLASGNKEALDIVKNAGEIYNQVCIISDRLSKLGNTMNMASKQYNDIVTGLIGQQGLHGKVGRFKTLSNTANKTLTEMQTVNNSFDNYKLEEMSKQNEE